MRLASIVALLALAAAATPALADALDLAAGKALFDRRWVQALASTKSADGLGPLFNAQACATCHKGGGPARFVINEQGVGALGFVVRLGTAEGTVDPVYGRQIQERAVPGLIPEARVLPRLTKAHDRALSAMEAELDLTGPPLADGIRTEIRVAPSLAGRGLIAEVDPNAILALADPDDADGDGISGRVRQVRTPQGMLAPGRFGLKAGGLGIADQVVDAAFLDMGLSSPGRPNPHGDCSLTQADCQARAGRDAQEMTGEMVDLVARYVASLKRPKVPEDRKAEALFASTGCAACHRPSLPMRSGGSAQVFSDLLLHDLGPALSGKIGEEGAEIGEWRTAPLIDLDPRLGMRRYLHDGRAGSVEEAVLWHDGEAAGAKERFGRLSSEERKALIDYVSRL